MDLPDLSAYATPFGISIAILICFVFILVMFLREKRETAKQAIEHVQYLHTTYTNTIKEIADKFDATSKECVVASKENTTATKELTHITRSTYEAMQKMITINEMQKK